ncbi:MAG: hypothetical protein Q9P90_18190 [candidate division KSB1 bacterium]|nr:hypothetical protein [candidate division KSB1 bacterium]
MIPGWFRLFVTKSTNDAKKSIAPLTFHFNFSENQRNQWLKMHVRQFLLIGISPQSARDKHYFRRGQLPDRSIKEQPQRVHLQDRPSS